MNALAGTGSVLRLILRRDRLRLPIWIALVAAIPVGIASSFATAYPTPELRASYAAEVTDNPAVVALLGPVLASSIGGLTAWRVGVSASLVVGLASLLTVIRHTRTEEEGGRRELLGSAAVGRQAPLTAALLVALGANLVVALLVTGGLASLGLPLAGSLALGLAIAAVGCTFAAVASVAAQVTEGAGAARGLALTALGLSYLVWVAGSASPGLAWLAWFSPFGWAHLGRPFANERWAVFAVSAGAGLVLTGVAYALAARRDVGAGAFPPRLGPATASPGLRSPLALAWRLQRGMLLGWCVGFLGIGVVLGAAVQSTVSVLRSSPALSVWIARMGGRDASDAFLTLFVYLLVELSAGYAILATLRLRAEEEATRAELVLAASVSRLRWATSHLVFGGLGPATVLAALGAALGVTYGLGTDQLGQELPRVLAATLGRLPAVWVMVGITVAFFGVLPRFAAAGSWAVYGLFVVLELGWEFGLVSRSVFGLSPFAHVYPLDGQLTVSSIAGLAGVAVALTAAGLGAFRLRDVG